NNRIEIEISFPSHTYSILIADSDSLWTEAFGRDFSAQCRNLNVMSPQEIEHSANSECMSWESLPFPALDRISFELRSKKKRNLINLAQVSKHFYAGVNKFMNMTRNRPALKEVVLIKVPEGLAVETFLVPSNLLFYGLSNLDSRRFMRSGSRICPRLLVTLNGTEDPAVEQLYGVVSGAIKEVEIFGWIDLSPDDFSSISHLFRDSTIEKLQIRCTNLDDTTASHIISIVSHVKVLRFSLAEESQLTDPSTFIIMLGSAVFSSIELIDSSSSFFGLPHSFWENYFNENLTNGSIRWVEAPNMGRKTKAPINLPGTGILKWKKK
ncbi:hypothetical protein PMAYCL1PPCAC_27429, partial [Pristionchus mayeri]